MPALTPSFLFDFESNMQAIVENEYARMSAELYWSRIMKTRPSSSKKEVIAWLLSTAKIKDTGKGGNIGFEDLVAVTTTFENKNSGSGLRLDKNQVTDLDGSGLELAAKWSSDIGAYMAYWPQKQLMKLIKAGETTVGYDAKNFFAGVSANVGVHPYNPFRTSLGGYANLFTGAAIPGANIPYPGACPIDATNAATLDVAFNNLAKVIAYIRAILMPNGEDPRFLRPTMIVHPPALTARVQQLTNAKFLAQAAASGGGSGDVEAVIRNYGFGDPIEAPELSGDDTTYYIGCEEIARSSQLGAFVYVDREPYAINYYTGDGGGTGVDAILDRQRRLEWHAQGRNVTGPGHPYMFFKVKAT